MKHVHVSMRLPPGLYVAVARHAEAHGLKFSSYVRRVLQAAVAPETVLRAPRGVEEEPRDAEGLPLTVGDENPLEYVRAVREELERRARQYQGAKRW